MDVCQCKSEWYQAFLFEYILRKSLLNGTSCCVEGGGHDFVHDFSCNSGIFELFSRWIDSSHRASGQTVLTRVIYLGMNHIQTAAEKSRLSEENECRTDCQFRKDILDSLEKDKFQAA